ncbi:MAG: HlyD family efflux transporter periplasmic adaptor subunit [Treponema sp.]|nr:HlyD family efflux transporter periplasmic adaptor subunit [Treponema sp.]
MATGKKKKLRLYGQESMTYTKEFLLLQVPREVSILFFTIVLLFATAVAIVVFVRIDDVIKAGGIVRTKDNVSGVHNVIAGRITERYYSPGAMVHRGDALYRIDSSAYDAQYRSLRAEKESLAVKIDGIRQLKESYDSGRNLVEPSNAEAFARFEYYLDRCRELEIQEQIAKKKYLAEKNRPASLRREKAVEIERLNHEQAFSALESLKSEFAERLFAEEKTLSLSFQKNEQELSKLDSQFEYLCIKSPIDGYVQELSSLNAGDYVEAGKTVLNIVPDDAESYRVEIRIAPKDIGKISRGMKVKFRLTAFPYFEYQGANGTITSVDPDIRSEDGKVYYYSVYADIDRTSFSNRRGECYPIRAGLETHSRIVLRTSTILMFVLRRLDFLY